MRQSPPTAWACDFGPATCVCRFPAWSSCLAWKPPRYDLWNLWRRLPTIMPISQCCVLRNAFLSDFRLYGISSKLQEFEKQGLQKVSPTGVILSNARSNKSANRPILHIVPCTGRIPLLAVWVMFASNPDLCLPDVPLTLRSTGHPTVGCATCRGGCT